MTTQRLNPLGWIPKVNQPDPSLLKKRWYVFAINLLGTIKFIAPMNWSAINAKNLDIWLSAV